MSTIPDFSAHGFQIIRELGRNPGGGRVTYLAQTPQNNLVVLKQFQFATGGTWAGMKAIEREIQVLQDLKHPGIPRYLGSFETSDGFCLLQEYKDAQPLSTIRSFRPDDIKHIAVSLLDILVYLQDRIPPVFHRDIKPENVLVSDNLQVYLIDFGFARIGGENLAMSSVAMGTFGFMAPEQTRNLQLTTASDLYGLGLTLVCVIAQLKSHEIGEYVDFANQLDQKAIESKLKGCSLRFIDWLNQMVAPDPKKRFTDAQTALEALKPLYVKRTPSVEFDRSLLEFQATKLGEKLSQTVTLSNSVPETILEGYWEVAPHPNDPPHTPDTHSWISFTPKTVQGNEVNCKVTVDTTQLQIQKQGSRQLVFHSNAEREQIFVTLQVSTVTEASANSPVTQYLIEASYSTYIFINMMEVGMMYPLSPEFETLGVLIAPLASVLVIFAAAYVVWLFAWGMALVMALRSIAISGSELSNIWSVAMYGSKIWAMALVGCMITFAVAVGASPSEATGVAFFALVLISILSRAYPVAGSLVISLNIIWVGAMVEVSIVNIWTVILALAGFLVGTSITTFYKNFSKSEKRKAYLRFWLSYYLAIYFGVSIGLINARGFDEHLLIPATALTSGAALLYCSIAPIFHHRRQLATYRRQEQHLIEP